MEPRLDDGTYVVLSDIQAPLHDARAVSMVTEFVADFRPDGILCVGDEADQPEISRWSKGTAEEYAPTFEAGLRSAYDVMHGFAKALGPGKPFHVMRSNHTTTRLDRYLRYAPAFGAASWMTYPRLMGYGTVPLIDGRDEPLPVTFHHKMWEFAPGWMLAHGDESGMSRAPGGTALALAVKAGRSVVCGHTHKIGVQHHTSSVDGRITGQVTGVEVGHLMDEKQAGYVTVANWQKGFALMSIQGRRVQVDPIRVDRGGFLYWGDSWPV